MLGVSGLNNMLYYKLHNRNVVVDATIWRNMYLGACRYVKKKELSLTQLRDLLTNKSESKSHHHLLPLKPSSKVVFQSMCPILPRTKGCDITTMDHIFEGFAIKNSEKYDLYNDENYGATLPNGGWDFARPHLERYGEERINDITYDGLLYIIKKYGVNWKIPKFKFKPTKADIDLMYVKPESYSGLMTGNLFGETKKLSIVLSNQVAKVLFDLCGSKLMVDTSLKTVGGREKLNKYSSLGDRTVTRCVLQEETPITQLKQIYSRPITNAYRRISHRWDSGHGIGVSLLGENWDYFVDKITQEGHRLICGDWSSHDTYVSEVTMNVAFGIMRAMWPDSSEVDRHFFFFTSGHVYKRVITPGGFVYRIDGGIMSGCPFTSHMNTICCRLEVLFCFDKLKVELGTLFTYGDDWIATICNTIQIPRNIEEKILEITGIKMKDLKVGGFHGSMYMDSGISFLQTFSYNGEPGREFNRIVQKLRYCDTKSRKSIRSRIDLACNMLMSNIGNEIVTNLILEYIDYLCKRQGINSHDIQVQALKSAYILRFKRSLVLSDIEQYTKDLQDPDKYFGYSKAASNSVKLSNGNIHKIIRCLLGNDSSV